jgi:quercetin dioxygenase-like cupin family protein
VTELFSSVDLSLSASGRPAYNAKGRATRIIVDLDGIRALLVWMRAGAWWTEHRTSARITVQTLEGEIRLHSRGKTFAVPARHLLALESNVAHDVEATEDSVFLLTVAKAGVAQQEDTEPDRQK